MTVNKLLLFLPTNETSNSGYDAILFYMNRRPQRGGLVLLIRR